MTSVDNQATVLALRMWRSLLATQELLSAYLGVRLGLYEDLAAKLHRARQRRRTRGRRGGGTPRVGWGLRSASD